MTEEDITRLEAHEILSGASDEVLQMAIAGQIDLNALARVEFRSRRRNEARQWIDILAAGQP